MLRDFVLRKRACLSINFNLSPVFLIIELAVNSPDKYWSSLTPRYFTEVPGLICLPPPS